MAAPAHTARSTPTGSRLDDGFKSLIAFASNASIKFWEKSVTPPGLDGGDAINISTMHNTTYRTFSSSSLITATEVTTKVAYDPAVYDQIIALINVEGAITVHFPNSTKISFFGFLRVFEPDELVEGQQPEATITIIPTNYDPVNKVEAAPLYGT
jgi:hypothetical protein